MKEVYIVSAVRTAIGSFGGSLAGIPATGLGAMAIRGAIYKAGIKGQDVQEVYMGSVLQANLGQAPARQAAKYAGLPDNVQATTVNKVCASGMKSVMIAAQSIMCGDADVVVAGGMESMSLAPFYSENMRWGNKYGNVTLIDGIAKDGLIDCYHNYPMGNASDFGAKECNISREEQDAFAIQSYQRAQAAQKAGRFIDEIVPISIPQRNGSVITFKDDEECNNVKFDKVPGLKPAFSKEGTATAVLLHLY
jgi:acetyl-CoA C-acetyltransferase